MCHQVRKSSAGCAGQGTGVGVRRRIWGRGCKVGVVNGRLFSSGPVCSASLHTTWSHIEEQAPQIHCLDCPSSVKRSGGTSRLIAGSDGRRNQWNTGDGNTGSTAARDSSGPLSRNGPSKHSSATARAALSEAGSAERAAGPCGLCPTQQFRFAWRKTERFSKAVPAPNAESSRNQHGLLLRPPYFKQIRREAPFCALAPFF